MRANLRAMRASFHQRWKELINLWAFMVPIAGAMGPAITIGWVVGRGDNPAAISYIFIGISLWVMWAVGLLRTAFSLANEQWAGTLDLMMTTPTPLFLIMLGKTLAIIANIVIAAGLVFLVALAFSGRVPPIDSLPFLVVSALLAVLSLVAALFVTAPYTFIHGAHGGFFNAFIPLGGVITGFLYPIDLLPAPLEVAARCLPTSWAMEAVIRSIEGSADWKIIADWGVAGLLSAVFLAAAALLFKVAEKRVRVAGNLGVA